MSKLKFDVYLAGSMSGRSIGQVLNERHYIKALCIYYGLSYYDPAASEGLEDLPKDSLVNSGYSRKTMVGFVKKDERNLDKCKVVLNTTGDTKSDGTTWEMARAYYFLKRPIVIVSPQMAKGALMNFSTIKAERVFTYFRDALYYIKAELV